MNEGIHLDLDTWIVTGLYYCILNSVYCIIKLRILYKDMIHCVLLNNPYYHIYDWRCVLLNSQLTDSVPAGVL